MNHEAPPLDGLKVVDFTHERAGPYCTRLLAGYGAQVVKIERPGVGDLLRHRAPYVGNVPGIERSLPFHWLNAGKRSITLDLKVPGGVEVARQLIGQADVVVESFSPGVMDRLGLSRQCIRALNERAIVTSISNFGQDGPYRDYRADESVLYAMSGGMVATGDADRPPLDAGPAIVLYTAGLHAYIGTLVALHRSATTNVGEHVDVSIQESAIENIELQLSEYLNTGKVARRNGDDHPLVPWRCYPCKDGYAAIIGGPMRHWHAAAELFEAPELAAAELAHVGGRIKNRQRVEELMRPWLEAHDGKEIYHKGQAAGLAFGYLASLQDVLDSPQHAARNFFTDSDDHPEVGRLRMCSGPFRTTFGSWQTGRAPLLGEHTREILDEWLDCSSEEYQRLKGTGIF